MKDILNFINSIGYSNFKESVTTFFDENIALYNLIGNYNIITHNECPTQIDGKIDRSSIKFILTFDNEEDAKKMHKIMNGSVINVFGRNFHTSQTLYGSSIEIEFF